MNDHEAPKPTTDSRIMRPAKFAEKMNARVVKCEYANELAFVFPDGSWVFLTFEVHYDNEVVMRWTAPLSLENKRAIGLVDDAAVKAAEIEATRAALSRCEREAARLRAELGLPGGGNG